MTRNMRSFSEKVGHLIPLPSPSRYLKKILKMRIEEVPFCEGKLKISVNYIS